MTALTVNFGKHSGPTVTDDMAPQTMIECGNFTLDLKQCGFSPLFLQILDKLCLHLRRGLWITEHFSSSSP